MNLHFIHYAETHQKRTDTALPSPKPLNQTNDIPQSAANIQVADSQSISDQP
jgi:hypothetical protein